MHISVANFKKITKLFQEQAKHLHGGDVIVNYGYGRNYEIEYNLRFSALAFKTIAKMHQFCKSQRINLNGLKLPKLEQHQEEWFNKVMKYPVESNMTLQNISPNTAKNHKTLKLVPEDVPNNYRPCVIGNSPLEITEGGYTYRVLTQMATVISPSDKVRIIARNDEPIYDYLDQGFYYMRLKKAGKNNKTEIYHVVANEYDVHVAHIFMMCKIQPKLTEMLQNGCFINVYDAEMTRLRMAKKLTDVSRKTYNEASASIDNDYKKNTTLIVVGKLLQGEVEKTTVNEVVFTKNSASYAQVSIEAEGLLDILYKDLNFNGEFDIYTISEMYGQHVQKELLKCTDKEEVEEKVEEADDAPAENAEEKVEGERTKLPMFKINGVEITPSISSTCQRYLNDVRINKDEIGKAIHRASCHRNAEDYKHFLKSISRMSIKWHDIIANGMGIKVHDMDPDEYRQHEAGPNAPALRFYIDKEDKYIKLQINENRGVRVALGKLIRKVEYLNKRTDRKQYYPKNPDGWYNRVVTRNNEWCATELVKALIDCCSFPKKVVKEDGTVEDTKEVLITKEDITKLLAVVNEHKKAVIERSKQFLNTAVKLTGAERIEFMGKWAYKVKGGLREYAVIIDTAKVYDYATKQYRCIVNDRHYAGAGYDDIAARLLALKNDSMMQDQIRTLAGAAQPLAENAHNDYVPERDVITDNIERLVDRATNTQ